MTTLIRFLLSQHGRETARAELTGLIEQAENAFPLELMLAQFDIQTGETGAAIAYLKDLVGRGGENATEARVLLAQLLVREGRAEEAEPVVAAILEADPNNVDALVHARGQAGQERRTSTRRCKRCARACPRRLMMCVFLYWPAGSTSAPAT